MFGIEVGAFDISAGVVSLGLFTGLTYALLAAGLVLVFRSSRFINFAHGAIGVFGAAVCSLAVRDLGLPYWVALLLGIVLSAMVAAGVEIGVVKPLASAPKVLSMVATLGVSTFLIFTSLTLNPTGLSGLNFPKPTGMPQDLSIGALEVTPAFAAQAIISPIVLIALGLFIQRSTIGMTIRAAASNPEAAATAGVGVRAASVTAWALAGGLAALSVCLIIPTKGVVTPDTLGFELLIRGLAAAAVARFASYPIAIGTATAIGVLEQVLATNPDAKGLIELVIFAIVLVTLLASKRGPRATIELWGQRSLPRKLPQSVLNHPFYRFGVPIVGAASLGTALYIPFIATGTQALNLTIFAALAIVSLSLVIVTGLGGQLSLAQFAYGGIAAAVSVRISADYGFLVGVLVGTIAAGLVATALAAAALRIQGLALGVASLIFAVLTSAWLLDKDILLGNSEPPVRPDFELFGVSTSEARGYYWISLAALLLVMVVVWRLRHSAWARTVVAIRDNPEAAQAMSLPERSIKLQVAAVGGLIAGIGGAVYGHTFSNLSAANFDVQLSIDAITAAVIGGLGSIFGPIIGAFYLSGIPSLFSPTPEASSILAGLWLILIVQEQGGLAELFSKLVNRLSRHLPRDENTPLAEDDDPKIGRQLAAKAAERGEPDRGTPILAVSELSKSFGGINAVSEVSFEIAEGEVVGLIGPNGAGKTTLFEMASGFVRPSSGTVTFRGKPITKMAPSERSRLGISRSFQAATLYPTLTVTETLMVARERVSPSSIVEAFGRGGLEKERRLAARSLIKTFDLESFAETEVAVLPTGTRRLVELAAAVACQPKLMLLDEPSAGIAHSELEAVELALNSIRYELGITLVIIEHDLALLGAICDRMIALEVGAVVAQGTVDEVRSDPAVIASYVGTTD